MNIFVFIILQSVLYSQSVEILPLTEGWKFKKHNEESYYDANVPGNIFLDLQKNNIIQDPFFGDNEQKVQWVSHKGWIYELDFKLDNGFLNLKKHNLVFEGLDTYAEVKLNGKNVLEANNMFRKWIIPVSDLINKENKIQIIFTPSLYIDSIKAASYPYLFPDSRSFTRKAPYQNGWDWGAKLVTMGIWKKVYLEGYDNFKINDIYIQQNKITKNKADISAIIEIVSEEIIPLEIEITDLKNNISYAHKKTLINKENNRITIDISINNPKLWWPNGMGQQNIYQLLFKFKIESKIIEKTLNIGLRTIRLVQKPDDFGSSFYFEVNGKPVYAKGANYIPQDNFPSSVSNNKYESLIKNAVKSNMNMLRVWGGGIYERDIFYDLCDKYGIMVWQDFIFACNFYPEDSLFIENIKHESKEQIIRLRNHPCISLWCGNNEIDEAWHNWGYQKSLNYSYSDSLEIWNNYNKLFTNLLPGLVEKFNPETDYISTSPKIGWGHQEALLSGDMHYWGVWWGSEPFEIYEKHVGRFMSEYGFQGFPDIKTIKQVVPAEDLNLNSSTLLNHQKHPRGMSLINDYMERDFPVPSDFEDYIYMSQLVQAYGVNIAIEAHRRNKPYCMGTLYWQFNDSWPVISWSGIDYYGRWKALQYYVENAYETVLISHKIKGDFINVFVVSDSLKDFNALIDCTFNTFDGREISQVEKLVFIDSKKSNNVLNLNIKDLTSGFNQDEVVLKVNLKSSNNHNYEKLIYLVKPKELELSIPEIEINAQKINEYFEISLKSKTLVKNVQVNSEINGYFSNNYFDMFPGEKYKIKFFPKDKDLEKLELSTKTLNDFVNIKN